MVTSLSSADFKPGKWVIDADDHRWIIDLTTGKTYENETECRLRAILGTAGVCTSILNCVYSSFLIPIRAIRLCFAKPDTDLLGRYIQQDQNCATGYKWHCSRIALTPVALIAHPIIVAVGVFLSPRDAAKICDSITHFLYDSGQFAPPILKIKKEEPLLMRHCNV